MVTHFKLLSPKRLCQRQVPAANEEEEDELLEAFPVEDALCCLLKDGRLRLRWSLFELRPLSLFLWPPRFTKLTSASSSSLKAEVNVDGVGAVAAVEVADVGEELGNELTWLMGVVAFSVGRP